jgi:hypothetical protein
MRGLARVATYGIPIFSVGVAALVFLGPGAHRAVLGARVLGQPAEGSRGVALRIETARSYFDVVEAAAVPDLVVEAAAAGQELPAWHGASGPDGVAEALLQAGAPLAGPIAVRVSAVHGKRRELLAEGVVDLHKPAPPAAETGALKGAARGEIAIHVYATRGWLAAPFPEELWVSAAAADAPDGIPASITLSGAGLEITPPSRSWDGRGHAPFQVKAIWHHVDLEVTARAGAREGHWEGTLPVVPGAIWLDPASVSGPLTLVSPSPREPAYVSLWTEEGRVAGAVVPLARDAFGFYRGTAPIAVPGAASVAGLTVAGDAREHGSGTVTWPIRPTGCTMEPPPMPILLDGVPASVARDDRRAWTARRIGLALIGAAAFAEVVLLLLLGRASQRRLEAHLATASSEDEEGAALPAADRAKLMEAAREHPLLRALLGAALLVLAFAMLAALATFR